jgi:tricarballylate dehydrogenase
MKETHNFDVVVLGHGIAGLTAAVSAMQHGAKVAVLERAPVEESGGCTRYTEAFLRLKSENELSDDFDEEMAEVASANPDPNLINEMAAPPESWGNVVRAMSVADPEYLATFSREAVPTIHWLKTFGVRFIPTYLSQITSGNDTPMIVPLQSKAGYIDARPLTASSAKSTCDARPDHTYGSIAAYPNSPKTGLCPLIVQ